MDSPLHKSLLFISDKKSLASRDAPGSVHPIKETCLSLGLIRFPLSYFPPRFPGAPLGQLFQRQNGDVCELKQYLYCYRGTDLHGTFASVSSW